VKAIYRHKTSGNNFAIRTHIEPNIVILSAAKSCGPNPIFTPAKQTGFFSV
jgi:hypothetical protein